MGEDNKQFDLPDLTPTETGFAIGATTVDAHSPKSLAKKVEHPNGVSYYFVKADRSGFFYNPWGIYSEGKSNVVAPTGRNLWEYRRVEKKAFDLYLRFLATQNLSYLLNAQRVI